MKIILIIVFLCFSNTYSQQQPTDSIAVGSLIVIITDIDDVEGKMNIALSNTRENFESRSDAYRGVSLEVLSDTIKYTFTDLHYGEYAIKVHHDEDGDEEFDTNFLGIPSEDYGFSNNASASFGPADYDDAKFLFNKNYLKVVISLD